MVDRRLVKQVCDALGEGAILSNVFRVMRKANTVEEAVELYRKQFPVKEISADEAAHLRYRELYHTALAVAHERGQIGEGSVGGFLGALAGEKNDYEAARSRKSAELRNIREEAERLYPAAKRWSNDIDLPRLWQFPE